MKATAFFAVANSWQGDIGELVVIATKQRIDTWRFTGGCIVEPRAKTILVVNPVGTIDGSAAAGLHIQTFGESMRGDDLRVIAWSGDGCGSRS